MDFGSCLLLHTPRDTGNDVAARPGGKETGIRGAKATLGYSHIVRYFPWFVAVPVVSPSNF